MPLLKLEDLKYLFKPIVLKLLVLELHNTKVCIPSELDGLIVPSMLSINDNPKNIHYLAVLFLKHQIPEYFALTENRFTLSHH